MDKNAVELLKKVQKVLEDADIGVIGIDDEFDALIVGGLEGVQEYSGVRIELEDEALVIVLEISFQGEDISDKEQAIEYFKHIFGDLLAEEQEEIELDFDEEEGSWGTELVMEWEGDGELVESVQGALEHGLWFRIDGDEEEDEEEEGSDEEE